MNLAFTPNGWADFQWWLDNDKTTLKRVRSLIRDALRDPRLGIGKPEELKHFDGEVWSRRITQEHRFVYDIDDETLTVLSLRYHY